MALKSHILLLAKRKIRLWRGRESDVSSGRQALETFFFLLTSPKFDSVEVEKTMSEGLVSNIELIFGILIIQKCDLFEVEKAMFELHLWHFQHIFDLWTIPICDLVYCQKSDFFSG